MTVSQLSENVIATSTCRLWSNCENKERTVATIQIMHNIKKHFLCAMYVIW